MIIARRQRHQGVGAIVPGANHCMTDKVIISLDIGDGCCASSA